MPAIAKSSEIRPGVVAQWVDPQEEQALTADISGQLSQLPTVIDSPETYRRAKESLPLLKRAEDKVLGFFVEIKDAAFKAHKAITTKETAQLKPIKDARTRLAGLIFNYESQLERIRRENERKAQEEEQRRRESEAVAEAEALSDQGAPEMAEQVLEHAIAAPSPVVILPSAAVEVAGVSIRENWQFLYSGGSPGQKWKDLSDDQRKRVIALIPREFLIPDESAIGRVVKAMKSGTKIPGVQAYDAGTVAVRG
jgi:hypothetical protein